MSTWADRARAAQPSQPKQHSNHHHHTEPEKLSHSNASSSDNWRAPAPTQPTPTPVAAVPAAPQSANGAEGWTVAEKKERKQPSPAPTHHHRERKQHHSHPKELPAAPAAVPEKAATLAVPSSSSWAASSPDEALPSPNFDPVPSSSLLPPTQLDLPTPTPTPTPSADAVPSIPDATPPPPPLPPKVNPWAGVKKVTAAPIVPVVAGASHWPSPHEKPASKKSKRDVSADADESTVARKKGEKKSWVPIKAEITHNASTPSNRFPSGGEKRPKAPRRDGAAALGVPKVAGGANGAGVNGSSEVKDARPAGQSAAARPSVAKKDSTPRAAASTPSSTKLASTNPSSNTASPASPNRPPKVSTSSHAPAAKPSSASPTVPTARADFALPKKPTPHSASNNSSAPKSASSSAPAASAPRAASTPSASTAPILRPFSNNRPPPATSSSSEVSASVLQPLRDAPLPFVPNPAFNAAFRPANNHPRGAARGAFRGRGAMAGAPRGPYAPSAVRSHTETVVPVYAYAPVVMTPEEETKYWLLGQIEYYFSVDNLCRDMFLRQKMDSEGWLSIALIASFNRIKNLSTDPLVILATMIYTPLLEVSASQTHVRLASGGWQHWVLPNAVPSTVVSVPAEDGHESTSDDGEGTGTSMAATTVSTGSQADDTPTEASSVEKTA